MKYFLGFAWLLAIISSCSHHNQAHKTPTSSTLPIEHFNFVVIIADDAGWNDIGYHNSEIYTPVIDSMATKSVTLNRLYAHPTCSPTRAALLTGLPASRMGIVAPISGRSTLSIHDSVPILTNILKSKDYQTALFGKWHLGLSPKVSPNAYGFDYSYGFLHGQIDQYTHRYKNGDQSWHRNGVFLEEEGHTTDLVVDDFVRWVGTQDSAKPFYAQIAFSAPHFPLQEEEIWKKPYAQLNLTESRLNFVASMTHMDYGVGKILQALDQKGLKDNTIVIFFSDNGGMESWFPEDQYDGVHGPNPTLGDNAPLRGWKGTNYEGGIRVPGWLYFPDEKTPHLNNTFVSVSDLFEIIKNYSGLESGRGEKLRTAFQEKQTLKTDPIYIRGHQHISLIDAPYKIIQFHSKGEETFELYNIVDDPTENTNLATAMPEKLLALVQKMKMEMKKDPVRLNFP